MDDTPSIIAIAANETVLRTNVANPPHLTPTGKISYAKTRVYTQRYRKAWELMPDFKGWLTAVPDQPTRAFCTYCSKNLHAHRLSLLKHTCTMKHQRCTLVHLKSVNAKVMASQENAKVKAQLEDEEDPKDMELEDEEDLRIANEMREAEAEDEDDGNIEYVVERLDEDMYEHQENNEEVEYQSYDENDKVAAKKIKLENNDVECHDALAAAMAHVHGEYLDENGEPVDVELEMVVESVDSDRAESLRSDGDNEDNEMVNETEQQEYLEDPEKENQCETSLMESTASPQEVKGQVIESSDAASDTEEARQEEPQETPLSMPLRQGYLTKRSTSRPMLNTSSPHSATLTPIEKKSITLTTAGKTVTLNTSTIKIPTGVSYILNKEGVSLAPQNTNERDSVASDNADHLETPRSRSASTQQIAKPSYSTPSTSKQQPLKKNSGAQSAKPSTGKKPCISTHVLDTSKGLPVGGLQISLYKLMDGRWTFVNESNTTADGRCADLVDTNKYTFTAGRYKLHFDVDKYFTLRRIETMYPFIEIIFDVKNPTEHYHIPVLLSPFGYTTYRGS